MRGRLFAIAIAILSIPSAGAAQGGLYVGGGIGPAVRIDDWPTQVRLEQEIGYYFDNRPEGFFIGFAPSQSFADSVWILTFAPRFGYMFNLFRGSGITFQLGPTLTIPGLAVLGCYDARACDAEAYFHFSFSFMARVLLMSDHLAVYLRPLEFEFAFGDGLGPSGASDPWDEDAFRYVLEGGIHYHF